MRATLDFDFVGDITLGNVNLHVAQEATCFGSANKRC